MIFHGKNKPTCSKGANFRIFVIAMLALLLGVSAGDHAAFAYPSNNVPLDNWAYEGLDKLAGFGLIRSDVHGMRPYTRLEVGRLVGEALDTEKKEKLELPSLIEYFLAKFKREYKEELAYYGHGKSEGTATLIIKPIDEAKATYVYSQGRPEVFLNTNKVLQYPTNPGSGIVGWQGTPLLPNNQGIVYGQGSNLSFQFASSFELWGLFSGYVEPLFLVRQNGSGGTASGGTPATVGSYGTSDVDLPVGYLKFSPSDSFEIEVGRDSMWFGQGYAGSLILTDNAPPLDMIKISNPVSIILPWYFSYLGPFKYALYWARLEGDRDYPHTQYGGARVDFKPTRNLEIGMSRTFQFGGEGSGSPGTFYNWLKCISGANLGGGANNPENFEAAFDFRYTMPCLWNAQLYGEWGGEDTGFKPRFRELFWQSTGYILGLYVPKITADGRTDLRLEYTDNVNEWWPGSVNYDMWYTHGTYTSGMTYNGFILGDPIGPDARQGYLRVTRYVRNDLKVGLDGSYTERGANMGRCISWELTMGADVTYDINSSLTAMIRGAWGNIQNFDLVAGDTQQDNLLMLQLKYSF
ncbi:MAG: capsule assembly Wzi family protein [Syntrophobacteraceae bacterium]|nr:capsule assembly Wzi family protein [Syntrophobacteraceae bacterium]